jgi:hypothetical protein
MTRDPEAAPDWQLERYRLRELPADEQARVENVLMARPELRDRLAELDRSDRQILAEHPPQLVAEAIHERLAGRPMPTPPSAYRVRAAAAFAASAVIVALWALLPSGGPTRLPTRASPTHIKGLQPHLELYRQASPRPEHLADGATARAHDVIQLLYVASGSPYGSVVSVDGRGAVTVHLPASGSLAARLGTSGPVVLASAWELDDAPGFERFFFVTSDRPFAVRTVTEAAARLSSAAADRLELPPGLGQSTLLLRKDRSR